MAENRILSGIFSSWALFAVATLTALITAPYLVNQLGPSGYGLWSLFMTITGYFALFDFGVSPAIIRYTSKYIALNDKAGERRYSVTGLAFFSAVTLVLTLGICVAAWFYDSIFPDPGLPLHIARTAFLLAGLEFSLQLPFSVFRGILMGHQRYMAMNGVMIGVRLTRFIGVLTLVEEGPTGLITLAALFFATGLFRNFGFLGLSLPFFDQRPRLSDVRRDTAKDLLSYSLPAFMISVAIRLISYTDSLVIGYTISTAAITYYALAASLVDYVSQVGQGLTRVLVPVISMHETRGELTPIQERFLSFTRYSVWLVLPILVISYHLGPSFFLRWVGPDYVLSSKIMNVLMVAIAIHVLQLAGHAVLRGMSRHGPLAGILVAEALVNLALSIALAPHYGIIGVAWGTLVPRMIFSGVVLPFYTLSILSLSPMKYLRTLFVAALPGGIALSAASLVLIRMDLSALSWAMMVLTGSSLACAHLLPTLLWGTKASEKQWLLEKGKALRSRISK